MVRRLGACPLKTFSPQHDLTDVREYAEAALPADAYTRLYLLIRYHSSQLKLPELVTVPSPAIAV